MNSQNVMAEDVHQQVSRVEQEARMVLPGIQGLFGFQLIAVFNAKFFDQLEMGYLTVHLVALCATAISALLIMTPAAYHRMNERGLASKRFVTLASVLICVSMFFLAASICLDIDLISYLVLEQSFTAHLISGAMGFLFAVAWYVFPFLAKGAGKE